MRDILLSATAGFLSSTAAAFAVHRTLWRCAEDQAAQLDELVGHDAGKVPSPPILKRRDTFEEYIVRRFSQWWNNGVDNVHGRLLGLPEIVDEIVDDVKTGGDPSKVNK